MLTTIIVLLSFFLSQSHATLISCHIRKSNGDTDSYLAASLAMGNPRKEMTFFVDFSSSSLISYVRLDQISYSYSTDFGGTDLIYISNTRMKVSVTLAVRDRNKCFDCDGVLGLGKNSFLWRYWSEATITPFYINLGDVHELFTTESCGSFIVRCSEGSNALKDHMCIIPVTFNNNSYPLTLNGQMKHSIPEQEFYSYVSSKNIFRDTSEVRF